MRILLSFLLCAASFHLASDQVIENKEFISRKTLDLASSNNEFAFDLYKNLEPSKNLCFSPFSISSAFAMVYNGAREVTQKEMASVLRFKGSTEGVNEGFSALGRLFSKTPTEDANNFQLNVVNSLWIQTGMNILPQFLDDLAKYYKVRLHRADFLKQRRIAREEINTFVREKTMGRITDLLGPEAIEKTTKMVLISSIYMKMKWRRPFEKAKTQLEPFFVASDKTVSVHLMTDTGFYPYYQSDTFAAAELSYLHPQENLPDLKFIILLPNQKISVSEVEKKLNADMFKEIISHLESEELNIFLPKFTFTQSFSLKDVLMTMGMGTAFQPEADFSGITGSKDLKIGQAQHKVFIEVDENGTEAAAATSITMNTTAIFKKTEPILFRVDRPFVFLIYEKSTGSLLFCGRVVDPSKPEN